MPRLRRRLPRQYSTYPGITARNSSAITMGIRRRPRPVEFPAWRARHVFTAPRDNGIPPGGVQAPHRTPPSESRKRYDRSTDFPHFRHPERSGPHPPIARNSASALRAVSGGDSPSAMERIPRRRTSHARGFPPPCGKSSDATSSRWSACRTRSQSSTIPQKLRFTEAEERTAILPVRCVHAMSRRTYRCSAPPNRFRLRHADFPMVTRTPASRVKKVRRRSASPRSMARARNAGEEWKEGRINGLQR